MVPPARRTFLGFAALAALAAAGLAGCGPDLTGARAGDMALGDPRAKVTVVEYASASCSHCARFNIEVFPEFRRKYVQTGKVRYVFREYLTEPTVVAAAAFLLARCAGKDRYFAVLDQVFRSQQEMFDSGDFRGVLVRVASEAGFSEPQFSQCISDQKAKAALSERVERAVRQDHIQRTPTFVINGRKLEGEQTMAQLDAAIQPLLK
jgi:protein-disulfide isomerase